MVRLKHCQRGPVIHQVSCYNLVALSWRQSQRLSLTSHGLLQQRLPDSHPSSLAVGMLHPLCQTVDYTNNVRDWKELALWKQVLSNTSKRSSITNKQIGVKLFVILHRTWGWEIKGTTIHINHSPQNRFCPTASRKKSKQKLTTDFISKCPVNFTSNLENDWQLRWSHLQNAKTAPSVMAHLLHTATVWALSFQMA